MLPFNTRPFPRRMRANAGIALGPILFIIAILGILAAVISAGSSGFGSAGVTDRVAADIVSQANLIRAKINECNLKYGTNNNGDGYPASDTTSGTVVSALNCAGDPAGAQNLWSGIRATMLPQPTNGFSAWKYINTNGAGLGGVATGGRCIWIAPNVSNPGSNTGIVNGLIRASNKFTASTGYNSAAEVVYDPNSTSQKFVVWITMPTGTPDSNCLP